MAAFRTLSERPDLSAPQPGAGALAIGGKLLQPAWVRKVALMRALLEGGWFSDDPILAARAGAELALACQCGLPVRSFYRLRARCWCPGGRKVVEVGADHYEEGSVRSRRVALTATAELVVSDYLERSPPAGPDDFLLRRADGSPHVVYTGSQTLKTALRHMGCDAGSLTFGDAVEVFRQALLTPPRDDGLAQYLIGHGHDAFRAGLFRFEDPADEVVRRFLDAWLPLARPWPKLLRLMRDGRPARRLKGRRR